MKGPDDLDGAAGQGDFPEKPDESRLWGGDPVWGGDFYARNFKPEPSDNTLVLNLGPQHPSTHGVLRVLAELDGEYVLRAEPVLGYIHRMHEKMGEVKQWVQFYPNTGRVDYLHALAWNWAWCGAVERLAGLEVPERAEFIRVITSEVNRVASHLLWAGAFLLDLGAFTPIMYAFEDRERLVDLLQIVTGSRLTMAYFRFGGVSMDLTPEFIDGLKEFIPDFRKRLPMYQALVTDNVIFRKRCEGVGILDLDMCRRYGATGPVVRSTGKAYDVRRAEPHSVYDRFDFDIPTGRPLGRTGDCLDRYLVRMAEMEQSLRIIEQALEQLPEGDYIHPKAPRPRWKPPAGEAYFAVESARGKTAVHVVSSGEAKPYRVKLRSPSYSNLSLYGELAAGTLLADALVILGSLDLVIPEIER